MIGGEEHLELFQFDRAHSFETPKRPDANVIRLRAVHGELRQPGPERDSPAIHDFLPRRVDLPGVRGAQMRQQIVVRRRVKIRHAHSRRLRFMTHPPDASAAFVAIGMVARHFIVRNDLVVPVHDVEAAIGAELNRDRPKPRVAALDEIGQVLQAPAVAKRTR